MSLFLFFGGLFIGAFFTLLIIELRRQDDDIGRGHPL